MTFLPRSLRQVWRLGAIVLTILCLYVSPGLAASGDEGSAGAVFLKVDPYAESAAYGSANIARASHGRAVHFNPAGLSRMRHAESNFTQFNMIADITYNNLSLATPVFEDWGGFGLSATSVNYGDIDRTTINSNNNPNRQGTFGADDLSLSGAYGFPITDSVSLGLTYKYIRQTIGSFESTSQAFDAGMTIRSGIKGLQFGLSARNIGGEVKFNEESDPLPTTYGAGVNFRTPVRWGADEFSIGGQFVWATDAEPHLAGGLEYTIAEIVSLRTGYNGGPDAGDGFSLGGGVNVGDFSVDYAFVPMGELGNNQRLTLTYEFGHQPKELAEDVEPKLREQPDPYRDLIKPKLDPADVAERDFVQPEALYEWKIALDVGKQAYLNGQYEKARRQFLKVQEMRPNFVQNLIWLGLAEYKIGLVETAKQRLYRALELDPNNGIARRNLERITGN
jgi:hypothetical protein